MVLRVSRRDRHHPAFRECWRQALCWRLASSEERLEAPRWPSLSSSSYAEGAAAAHIQLKVKDQQGSEVQFKIKKTTPLRKLMDAYCSRLGLQASRVRFMVDGGCIGPDDSAEKLRLEDEDLIDVAMDSDE